MKTEPKLMVLGAGRGQVGIIRAASDMGVKTVVATLPSEDVPGLAFADKVVHVDVTDPQGILVVAERENVSAIATSCADIGLVSLGSVCDKLSLPGISENSARLCADKLLMKDAFIRGGVSTARYRSVENKRDLADAIEELKFPVIIKATDLQGSQGIVIARNSIEANDGFEHAMSLTGRNYLIVEQFVEGDEFGGQALIHDGKIVFIMLHGDDLFMARTAVPVGHYVPLDVPSHIAEAAVIEIERAIKAVGIDNCAVNVDLIVRGNEVFVIEITGRVGANGLPELVSAHFGLNYYEIVVRLALGEDISTFWPKKGFDDHIGAAAVRMVVRDRLFGVISEITIDSERMRGIEHIIFKSSGDVVNGFSTSSDCLGQLSVSASSLQKAFAKLDRGDRAVRVALVEGPEVA